MAALMSISLAVSQTLAYTARPRMASAWRCAAAYQGWILDGQVELI